MRTPRLVLLGDALLGRHSWAYGWGKPDGRIRRCRACNLEQYEADGRWYRGFPRLFDQAFDSWGWW